MYFVCILVSHLIDKLYITIITHVLSFFKAVHFFYFIYFTNTSDQREIDESDVIYFI